MTDKLQGWHPEHPLTRSDFLSITAGPRLEEHFSKKNVRERRRQAQKPKCPRCWNKQPAKKTCGYCGGFGRV